MKLNAIRVTLLLPVVLSWLGRVAWGGGGGGTFEDWYVLEMQGSRAGWARMSRVVGEEGRIISSSEMQFEIARASERIKLYIASEFVETGAGEPVSMTAWTNLGAGLQVESYTFEADGVHVTSEQGDRRTARIEPAPSGDWLTPAEVDAFVGKRLEAGATTITYATLDPTTGVLVYQQTHTVLDADATVEARGERFEHAIKWRVTQNFMPDVVTTEYVDRDGRTIRSQVPLGNLRLDTILADKAVATERFEAPEIMVSTLVRPDRPIREPRRVRTATYLVSVGEGRMPDLPEGGAQRVERLDDGTLRLTVDVEHPSAASDEDAHADDFLDASTMIDADDPAIGRLVEKACIPGESKSKRAERMRRFVHAYIREKNLGVGFASASEVCRTREGDCSEHGVLLAAMLRADGIPSRVVSGLVYIDRFAGEEDIFGYHLWTQALLEVNGALRWIDLDATLPDATPMDATHIAIAHASLADGDMVTSMSTVATLMGKIEVHVESTR